MEFISPKEASDVFLKSVNEWFTDGTEHYVSSYTLYTIHYTHPIPIHQVCLVDRDSGAYFWYNTVDGSTQWADAEGGGG
ncbi:hypothetical protein EON63_09105, partial [archaeon]